MAQLDLISSGYRVGEAPLWDPENNCLYWSDHAERRVHRYSADTGEIELLIEDAHVGGMALNQPGGLVLAGSDGLHLWKDRDNYITVASEFEGRKLQFNDMTADPQGRVFVGSMFVGEDKVEQEGLLYRFDNDCSISVVQGDIQLSNGLGFNPQDTIMYHSDSAARKIFCYDYNIESGAVANRQVYIDFSQEPGMPDGIAVDAEGGVWVAMWYGSCVIRYDAGGVEERRVEVPDVQTSSVCFGGEDLTDLYITAASEPFTSFLQPPGFDPEDPNLRGGLYLYRSDIPGLEVPTADLTELKCS